MATSQQDRAEFSNDQGTNEKELAVRILRVASVARPGRFRWAKKLGQESLAYDLARLHLVEAHELRKLMRTEGASGWVFREVVGYLQLHARQRS